MSAPTLESALDDVEARFLYNLPHSELEQTDRLFFQIEQAYWFYEDFKADKFSHLPHFANLKTFATKLFSHSELLSKLGGKFTELFTVFKDYKSKIPVYGVIMLNPKMTKAVLVCDYNGKSWTFPRGKIDENESEYACAVREAFEETGFDTTPYTREEDNLISFHDGKQIKLYVASNVPESTVFTIMCRKEISKVEFHPLDNLPKTYAVHPFLEKLKRWTNQRKNKGKQAKGGGSASASIPNLSIPIIPVAVVASTNAAINVAVSRKKKAEKSPKLSPKVTGIAAVQASPGSKRLKNQFDQRNGDTFQTGGGGDKGFSVADMFAANSKLTGKRYEYDGNPHQFGAYHPRYVDYTDAEVASRSLFGIASAQDDAFLALSEQSAVIGHAALRLGRDPSLESTPTTTQEYASSAPALALPKTAFDLEAFRRQARHDSFDSTYSNRSRDGTGVVERPVRLPFRFDRKAIMAAFDKVLVC
ncbi:Dcp2, box A domain-containing protein [Ochromonadaceae sp. CCMP2298]|nr:Dcp2, box A domain-containing protein [Ochromonadaceae sp. CCMP2298]|mmetsp:Transcript_5744/g.12645  ORF Transcript_5744/g.12645 Transcript_5744/m.12645 type:complete len:475 (-) Transcript_5744:37-1461(-)